MSFIHQGDYRQAVDIVEGNLQEIIKAINCELHGYFPDSLNICQTVASHCEGREKYLVKIVEAYAFWRLNNYDDGKRVISKLLKIMPITTMDDNYLRAKALNIYSLLLWKEGEDLNLAYELMQESLRIRKELGNRVDIAYSINNLGNIYLKMKDYDKTLDFYTEALEIRKELDLKPGLAGSYSSMGRYYTEIDQLDKALEFHEKSLEIWKIVKNKQFMGKEYRFMAGVYKKMGKADMEVKCTKDAIKLFKEIPNQTDWELTLAMENKWSN